MKALSLKLFPANNEYNLCCTDVMKAVLSRYYEYRNLIKINNVSDEIIACEYFIKHNFSYLEGILMTTSHIMFVGLNKIFTLNIWGNLHHATFLHTQKKQHASIVIIMCFIFTLSFYAFFPKLLLPASYIIFF